MWENQGTFSFPGKRLLVPSQVQGPRNKVCLGISGMGTYSFIPYMFFFESLGDPQSQCWLWASKLCLTDGELSMAVTQTGQRSLLLTGNSFLLHFPGSCLMKCRRGSSRPSTEGLTNPSKCRDSARLNQIRIF